MSSTLRDRDLSEGGSRSPPITSLVVGQKPSYSKPRSPYSPPDKYLPDYKDQVRSVLVPLAVTPEEDEHFPSHLALQQSYGQSFVSALSTPILAAKDPPQSSFGSPTRSIDSHDSDDDEEFSSSLANTESEYDIVTVDDREVSIGHDPALYNSHKENRAYHHPLPINEDSVSVDYDIVSVVDNREPRTKADIILPALSSSAPIVDTAPTTTEFYYTTKKLEPKEESRFYQTYDDDDEATAGLDILSIIDSTEPPTKKEPPSKNTIIPPNSTSSTASGYSTTSSAVSEIDDSEPVSLAEVLRKTINRGAPLFNQGKQQACYELYVVVAEQLSDRHEQLLHSVGGEPSYGAMLKEARDRAATSVVNTGRYGRGAWILRHCFDRILSESRETRQRIVL